MSPKQTGIGLISAIFLIVVVGMLALAITGMVKTSSEEFAQNMIDQRTLLAAQSGAQLGLNKLFSPLGGSACVNWTFDLQSMGLRSCTAVVQCRSLLVASETYYTLESDGRCAVDGYSAQRRIELRAKP